ncbi:MAG: hypothetical protein IPJ43_02585 [Saprospiraceae bacterium]|nr:hypothetical protein [Saprospiraceae bacterium]
MNEYCHNSFDKELGQVVEFNIQGALQNPRSDFYYETIKKNDAPIHRDIFKISEYSNKKYGQMWACYVSTSDPGLGKSKLIDTCFLVSNIDKDLKFIAKYNPDYDTNLWSYRGGDKELEDFYKLGRLIKVTRYLSPINNEWNIKEYNKDA